MVIGRPTAIGRAAMVTGPSYGIGLAVMVTVPPTTTARAVMVIARLQRPAPHRDGDRPVVW